MNVLNVVPMTSPPPPSPDSAHVPVLRAEVLAALDPSEGKLFVDATVGAGGHSEALLRVPGTRVIGVDRDPSALSMAAARLEPFGARFTPVHATFGRIEAVLSDLGVGAVDGVLADVGVSSMQLDQGGRGMSFRQEGPLDMRMDPTSGETALDLVSRLTDDELADVLFRLGEERRSRRIARCIKQAYAAGELSTTLDLRRAVVRAVGPARIGGVDPATRTFQALRVAVNRELEELESLLEALPRVLRAGGTAALISFHSLEDRIVKRALKGSPAWELLSKKPIVATDAEVARNPRARSAKLRAARLLDGDVLP